MDVDYIIVQAGGKGSRMDYLTNNKPKALVPVNNLPMIFHLFRKFPNKKYIIIGDYKYDVLEKYLKAFSEVDYKMVCASGEKGTCAGLNSSLKYVPDNSAFMLIWCDLVLSDDYSLPKEKGNYVGISKDFVCRWQYKNGLFSENKSDEYGVAGLFVFENKELLRDVPAAGEFVKWLSQNDIAFIEQPLYKTHEYGLIEEWNKQTINKCRPFNMMIFEEDRVIKKPIDSQGEELAKREIAWYKALQGIHFDNLPLIYDYEPLCMERIKGRNIYELDNATIEQKEQIITEIILCLKKLHSLKTIPADRNSYYEAYIGKTYKRLEKIYELVPFAKDELITINGKKCRNVFFHKKELEEAVMKYMPNTFSLIHGDCTFSNTMLREDGSPVMIDPRGYFGTTELYGDIAYDWVKLYYSLLSNYDQFNLKRFRLSINDDCVNLNIDSSNWENLEDKFFELLEGEVTKEQMRLLLAIIWLSLTTYAWEDYDSICGAFYNGLYYLEDIL